MSEPIYQQAYQVFRHLDAIRCCMPWLTRSGATVNKIQWQRGDMPTLIVDASPQLDGLTVKHREGKKGSRFDYVEVQGCIVAWPVSETTAPDGGESA